MNNKYINSKIYKLIDNTNGNIYIGSTIKTLDERLKGHRRNYKKYLNEKYCYVTSFEIIKNEDYKIELIELYPCENNRELEEREGFYIRNSNCVNKIIVGRTKKEYMEEYRELNKDRLKEYIEEYRELNKDRLKEYKKEYVELNKDKISEKGKITFDCICGSILRIVDRKRHFKTIKHINFMDSITN